ncbi:MAG TPA: tetratricopeptide repeat protein [Herpetosiphonaceae bacterium]|nr:tetratricopeptide repeat protein [Herpetosiphonaceae bacterium]
MAQLTISLLGAPRVEHNGAPIEVDTRKAIALIAYLAVTGHAHSRDSLATLLWHENGQTSARAALRRTLSALSKALGGKWLEVDRETIGLARDTGVIVDVDQFHEYLAQWNRHVHPDTPACDRCAEAMAAAVRLYRDDFLAGFTLRDSPAFDEWQFFQSESLRRELGAALDRLVAFHTFRRDWEPAIRYARRLLQLDPLHEPAHRQLMQLYAWSGERAAAIHQYRECVRVLEQELGVPPLEATTHLYQAIIENLAPSPPDPPPALLQPASANDGAALRVVPPNFAVERPDRKRKAPGAGLPFVGRLRDLTRLGQAYASIGDDGRLIVVQGEAGIGKTRLAEQVLAMAVDEGALSVEARCYEGEAKLAYGPFVEGLRAALAQPDSGRLLEKVDDDAMSEASRLLPELSSLRPGLPVPPSLESPGAQARFFEGLNELLLAFCTGPRPGMLFLDDVQWADAASLDLLTYLIRRLRRQPWCILLTWRTEQTPVVERLRHVLAEADRAGTAAMVKLERLTQGAVVELVRATNVAGVEPPPELAERLFTETEGLPFFVVEYLASVTRTLDAQNVPDWSLPGGVRDLLHSRLAEADETGRQLLQTAAVIGRSFDFDTLREASGRGEEETVTALEALIAHGLVVEVSGPADVGLQYDFSHEKLRSLAYDEVSLARRRLLHRRVADAIAVRARSHQALGALAGPIAHHYRLGGQETIAADYFKQAGEHARRVFANAEALDHFRSALALGHPETSTLHQEIGDLYTLRGEYAAAIASYETAAALCAPEALAEVEQKLGNVHHRRGEWELAESHLESALAALPADGSPGTRARIFVDLSLNAHRRGQAERAVALAEQALRLAETTGDMRATAQAHNMLGMLANAHGRTGDARQHLERSLELAELLDDPGVRVAALNNLSLVCTAAGQIERARTLAETALTVSASLGDRHRVAALHNNLADLLHTAGQPKAAMEHLVQAVTIFAEIGSDGGDLQPEIWKLTAW